MPSTNVLAWRNLAQHRLRTVSSALAVALGAAMTVAASVTSGAILDALSGFESAQTFLTGLLDQLDSMLTLVGVGITFAAGFLVFNAFAMSITQRRKQIGALRSLGMTRRQVMRLVLVEALVTGSAGTLVGLVAGPLLGRGAIGLMRTFTAEIFVFGKADVSLPSLLLATVLGLGVTLLSALVPAWRATRISPLTALRQETVAASLRSTNLQYSRVGLLLSAALVGFLVVAPPGEWVTPPWDAVLTGSFALLWMGCLLLVLPALIGGVGRWLRALLTRFPFDRLTARWGATGRLTADNLGRGRGRVMLTILTLAVALTMIVSMTGFIRFMFFELMLPKVESGVQQGAWMIAPFDYMAGMAAYTDLDSLGLLPATLAEARQVLEGRGHLLAVHYVIVPELSFLGSSYFSFLVAPGDLQQGGDLSFLFTFTEGDWETALPIMESGCGVLSTPLVANGNGVSVGEAFEVMGVNGPVRCTVAGIGSPMVGASVIGIPPSTARESFGDTKPLSAVVWPRPGVDRDALGADLRTVLARYPGVEMSDLKDMAAIQAQVMESLPNMLNALLLLAIVAAALGVVNTTVMSVAERRRELGLLRAVGATRRQVRAVVIGEAALMGLIGGGLGLVAGTGVVVILAVTYGGNGWGIPDLDLWGAACRSVQPALFNGLVGLVAAPFICAGAAWLPVRAILRGTAIETLESGASDRSG